VEGIRRVRYTSPHPKDLSPETIAAMAESPAVCEHLHLPLQAGSDATLAAMHRGYTAERYLERLAAARAAIPDLAVTTDLIVGFPGETDDDFAATLEVVAEAGYDSAYTFVFSPRPGTEAFGMADAFVPADVVAERFERLASWSSGAAWPGTGPGSVAPRRSSSRARHARTRPSSPAAPARTSSSTSPRRRRSRPAPSPSWP
jgi:tRNA-2-methylthio-N6-dimethylallyladenosine synthase